jgi:hypothetical protein
MVMSGVEAIGWRDDVSSLEHTPEQLSHECRILTCLFGQFFGTKGMVRCLQDFEDFLPLEGEGCASFKGIAPLVFVQFSNLFLLNSPTGLSFLLLLVYILVFLFRLRVLGEMRRAETRLYYV